MKVLIEVYAIVLRLCEKCEIIVLACDEYVIFLTYP
jgi:hypothetical protein